MSISDRCKALGPSQPGYLKFLRDMFVSNPSSLYDPVKNPDGIMILTIAENNLTLDMLKKKINEKGEELPDGQYNYGNNAYFLGDLAKFFSHTFFAGRELNPANLVVGNGCGSVINMLAYTLCNPGEGMIIPTPYYPGFDLDLGVIAGAVAIPSHMKSSSNFEIAIDSLQQTLDKAREDGVVVKGLILCSPNNPMGKIYSKDQLIAVLQWTRAQKLHLVVDEIYALSCFSEEQPFVSMSKLLMELGEDFGDYVHIVWSFSKDFSMSGFRVGVLYSENKEVIEGVNNQAFFYMSSNHTQFLLHRMVTDFDFVDKFIQTNQANLANSYKVATACLERVGLPYLAGGAGFFVLVDLRAYLLAARDWDAELDLWKFIATECKVVLTPGSSMHCEEPGWFRCCFAAHAAPLVEKALTRMAAMLKDRCKN